MSLSTIPSSSNVSMTSTIHGDPLPKSPPITSTHAQPELRGGIAIARQTTLDNGIAGPLSRVLVPSITRPLEPPVENPYPGKGTIEDPYLVDWLPEERANPYNWSTAYKWLVTGVVAAATLCIAFVSSSYSAAVQDVMLDFPGTTTEEGIAGLSLYVLGFGIGPLIWAPVSEIWGRNVAFVSAYELQKLTRRPAATPYSSFGTWPAHSLRTYRAFSFFAF